MYKNLNYKKGLFFCVLGVFVIGPFIFLANAAENTVVALNGDNKLIQCGNDGSYRLFAGSMEGAITYAGMTCPTVGKMPNSGPIALEEGPTSENLAGIVGTHVQNTSEYTGCTEQGCPKPTSPIGDIRFLTSTSQYLQCNTYFCEVVPASEVSEKAKEAIATCSESSAQADQIGNSKSAGKHKRRPSKNGCFFGQGKGKK